MAEKSENTDGSGYVERVTSADGQTETTRTALALDSSQSSMEGSGREGSNKRSDDSVERKKRLGKELCEAAAEGIIEEVSTGGAHALC
jgi:hypothetical protein